MLKRRIMYNAHDMCRQSFPRHLPPVGYATTMTPLARAALSLVSRSSTGNASKVGDESGTEVAISRTGSSPRRTLILHLTIQPENHDEWGTGDRHFSLGPDTDSVADFDVEMAAFVAEVMTPLNRLCQARRLLAEEDERNGELEIDWDTDSSLMLHHGLAIVNKAAGMDRNWAQASWQVVTDATFDEEGPQRPPGDDLAVAGTIAAFDELCKLCDEAKRIQERHGLRMGLLFGQNGTSEADGPFVYMDKVVEYLEGEKVPALTKMLPSTPPSSTDARHAYRESQRRAERNQLHARLLHSRLLALSSGEGDEYDRYSLHSTSLAQTEEGGWLGSWFQ